MRKILALASAFLAFSLVLSMFTVRTEASHSEPPVLEWERTYGGAADEYASCVVQTNDGGYAIAGHTTPSDARDGNFLLVKTDANGNMKWNQTYGRAGDNMGVCVIQTNDGGYAIAGLSVFFTGLTVLSDFWLIKLREPLEAVLPFWAQWWFWAIVVLGITTSVFASTTVYYQKRTHASKEPQVAPAKPVSEKEYKVCPDCGAKLPTDSAFCGKCGTSLK